MTGMTVVHDQLFAIRWLIARLNKFQSLHPEIQIRFTTSNHNVDFKHENFDVGITFGGEKIRNVHRQELLTERLTPVFSPRLLSNPHPINTIEDLRHHLLLNSSPDQSEWQTWATQVGIKGLPFDRGPVFEIDDAALQAAKAGIGVALGDLFMVKEDLASGRLVAPFAYIKVDTCKYYLSWPEFNDDNPGLIAFRRWLTEEINNEQKTTELR
jgi:LysR family glycine cleavage system transcriptional activator